ncbi:hypothetical protein Hgul01_04850 [Herpetosiphon gulosus]|uniref:Plasmid pRiA4b Orf3-like domain-containing protein n=2 Tax=Herpetosiphon gulosus TaxID=1973496 RepID=A0ABP9X998_9CHLR
MADGRQKNGGKRSGAGRKPSLSPLASVRLRDPDLQAKLAAVTRHEREVSHDPTISQERLIGMLIEEAHREMVAFQSTTTPMIDSPRNQFSVANRPAVATMAYQLVITIEEVTPRIWRRLVVTSDTTLAQLHTYLQIAFEWGDYHLHEFRLHGNECDEAMTLDQLGVRHGDLFDYIYDFSDYWLHAIAIEDCTPMNPRARYPRCTGGAQPGPEEDSGGAYAYSQKLARSRRAKAAAKKRTNNAGGTSTAKKKRSTSVRTFSQATVNRRLAAFCAGDPFYAGA